MSDPLFIGMGSEAHADYAAVSPNLPNNMATGDLVVLFAGCRNLAATLAVTAGWEVIADLGGHVKAYGRIYDSLFTAPTVTPSGGAAGDTMSAQCAAFRGPGLTVDVLRTRARTDTASHIFCPPVTTSGNGAVVLYLGWRQDDWSSAAAVAGSTLIDDPFSSLGSDQGLVWSYVLQTQWGSAPGGSFLVTGGSAALTVGATVAIAHASVFAATVGMSGPLWMPTRIRTDWAFDGYDGDRTFDDLGRQAGGWSVTHHLDDGLPDEVSFVAGLGVAVLAADLGGAPEISGPGLSARAYWSPLRTDSPVYGYDRDIANLTLDVGLVTSLGPEYVRVFTGQMADVALQGSTAALSGISANRLKLSGLVQPPAVAGRYEGARADWVISYALAASGVYLSPPAQPGCRFWAPMHGSVHPFIPSNNRDAVGGMFYNLGIGNDNSQWTTGPFHLAADFTWQPAADGGNRDYVQNGTHPMPLGDGEDLASQAGLRGKLEMWIFGYPYDFNSFPSASGGVVTWTRFQQNNANGTAVDMGLRALTTSNDRKPYINLTYNSGGSFISFTGTTGIPKDSQWHFLGLAYDFTGSNHKRWINVDGVVETDNTSISTSGFPATEAYASSYPRFSCRWPVAEVQVTAGAYANPDNFPWLRDIPFTPGARMTPSLINLVNVAETEPREAWELIGSFAQAELAMFRADEADVINYLGPAWWVKPAQQTVTGQIDTARNAKPVPAEQDPTKIRNAIRVSYDLAQSSTLHTIVGTYSSELGFSPGLTTFVLPLSTPAVELRGLTVALNDATGIQPTNTTYATLNTLADGTGTAVDATQAVVSIMSWHPGAATIQLDNRTGAFLYFANDVGWPALGIAGKPHYTLSTFAEDTDEASAAVRGARSLPVTVGAVQREVDARRLARDLKSTLSRPVVVIGNSSTGIEVDGDPRRQPGQLVGISDAETGIDDELWRLQTVAHEGEGAKYRTTVTVRRTLPILVIGQGRIGRTLIGPNSTVTDPESGI